MEYHPQYELLKANREAERKKEKDESLAKWQAEFRRFTLEQVKIIQEDNEKGKEWEEAKAIFQQFQAQIQASFNTYFLTTQEIQEQPIEEKRAIDEQFQENIRGQFNTYFQKKREEGKVHFQKELEKNRAEAQKRYELIQANHTARIQKLREENKTNLQLTPLTTVEKLNDTNENNEPEDNKDRNKEENTTEQAREEDKEESHIQNNPLPSNIQNIQASLHTEQTNLHIVQIVIQNCTQEIENKLDTTHMGTEKKSETILTPETPEEKLNAAPENTEQEVNEDRNNKETYTENMKTQQVKKINKGDIKYKIRKIKRKHLRRKHGKKGKLNLHKEQIHKQIAQYIYTNANKYNQHTLILGEKIGKRMVKKKPNLLYEGPFRIKMT